YADYRTKIVDRLGRQHLFQSSLLWLIEAGALTQERADELALLREHRNELVHDLFRYLADPPVDTDMELLADAIEILKGLERFWTQTELDIGAFDEYGDVSTEEVTPAWAIVFEMALLAFRQ